MQTKDSLLSSAYGEENWVEGVTQFLMCLRSVQYSPIHCYLKLSFSISLEADRLCLKDLSQLVTSELNQRLKADANAMEKVSRFSGLKGDPFSFSFPSHWTFLSWHYCERVERMLWGLTIEGSRWDCSKSETTCTLSRAVFGASWKIATRWSSHEKLQQHGSCGSWC